MPECLTQLVQFIFSAFNVISGVVSSSPSCFVFYFCFLLPIAKIKTSKLLFGTFLLIILMSVRVFSSTFWNMAHVKTAVSTLGPFYSLNIHPSGHHTSRKASFTAHLTSSLGFFFFFSPKLSPLYTSPFHPLHVLGYDKCNLFWIVIFMRCLNTYVLFVVAKTTQSCY